MDHETCLSPIRTISRSPYLQHPPPTFLSLPPETRSQIYFAALILPSPIIIWKGKWIFREESPPRRFVDRSVIRASLQQLAFNLLFSHPVISQEAAFIFYRKNSFAFQGDHDWGRIVKWLDGIGEANRNALARIEVDGTRPDQVWQCVSGKRVTHPGGLTKYKIYPRNPHLNTTGPPFKVGLVDNINPALEKVFELLGRRKADHKIMLIAKAGFLLPGSAPANNSHCPDKYWYGMELPNLIEKFRVLYTQGEGEEGSVEVLWTDKCSRPYFTERVASLRELGWQVTSSPEEEDEIIVSARPRISDRVIMTYTMRRDRLSEPLMAVDPNPYSYIYEGMVIEWIEGDQDG